jgi:hypothetical protein
MPPYSKIKRRKNYSAGSISRAGDSQNSKRYGAPTVGQIEAETPLCEPKLGMISDCLNDSSMGDTDMN